MVVVVVHGGAWCMVRDVVAVRGTRKNQNSRAAKPHQPAMQWKGLGVQSQLQCVRAVVVVAVRGGGGAWWWWWWCVMLW